jgi:hypothetical protein
LSTAAGRIQLITELLLGPEILGEDGVTVIGHGTPLITKEQAIELLSMSAEEENDNED